MAARANNRAMSWLSWLCCQVARGRKVLAVLDPRLDGGNPTTRGNDHLAREVETSTLPSQEISHSINLFRVSNFVRFLSGVPYLCLVSPSLSGGIH